MKPAMIALRATPQGEEYFELNREFPGSLPATKNHQGGLSDAEDESDAKIFSVPESDKCRVKTIKNYLSHLNPKLDSLFQRPREKARSFNPDEDEVNELSSRDPASPYESLPQGNFGDRPF